MDVAQRRQPLGEQRRRRRGARAARRGRAGASTSASPRTRRWASCRARARAGRGRCGRRGPGRSARAGRARRRRRRPRSTGAAGAAGRCATGARRTPPAARPRRCPPAGRTAGCCRSEASRRRRYDFVTFPIGIEGNVPMKPNILYLHSHDTGRYVQPYGHSVPTPNIQRLADQGLLFRQAFCAAPTCSGSRACLLTGQWAHSNGMIGLAHRGFELNDYDHHLVKTLRDARLLDRAGRRAAPLARPRRARLRPRRRHRQPPRRPGRPRRAAPDRRAPVGAVLPLDRVLRDPPRVLRADLGARLALLAPAGEPARHGRDAARHGLLQGQRAVARPRRRRGHERARRARPLRRHDRDPHHRPRARVPGRQGDADRPRPRRDADRARPRRLPRRQGLRGARLADRHLPDAVRAGGASRRPTGCRGARCSRSCGARPTRSTTPSSPS